MRPNNHMHLADLFQSQFFPERLQMNSQSSYVHVPGSAVGPLASSLPDCLDRTYRPLFKSKGLHFAKSTSHFTSSISIKRLVSVTDPPGDLTSTIFDSDHFSTEAGRTARSSGSADRQMQVNADIQGTIGSWCNARNVTYSFLFALCILQLISRILVIYKLQQYFLVDRAYCEGLLIAK